MSKITKEVVKHVAHLARLEFSEEEAEKMTSQLDKMIRYAEMLNELDTTNVEPTSHVLKMRNVMREDIPAPGMPRAEILKNAPDHKDGLFKVPSILE
jgi:aspartyl-tRNA(Asn)/glutamyl-tRNA(Gln) amidotransferase subunit C